jgi:hypothetical protein
MCLPFSTSPSIAPKVEPQLRFLQFKIVFLQLKNADAISQFGSVRGINTPSAVD